MCELDNCELLLSENQPAKEIPPQPIISDLIIEDQPPQPVQIFIKEKEEPFVNTTVVEGSDLFRQKAKDRVLTIVKDTDQRFRSPLSFISRLSFLISPSVGKDYLHSWQKRALDIIIAIPASFLAVPTCLVLGAIQKVCDGGPMFYWQERLQTNLQDTFIVPKIRSMEVKADTLSAEEQSVIMRTVPAEKDPRVTGIGKFLRRTDIDEFPQIVQVLLGNHSFVGSRAVPQDIFHYMKRSLPTDVFEKWCNHFKQQRVPGISGANQVFNPKRKDNLKRTRYENWYSEKASLGVDMYIIWRTLLTIARIRP